MSKESSLLIRTFLQRNQLSITEFSKMANISRWSIYKYLRGENIHPKTAKRIEDSVPRKYKEFLQHEKLIK